MKIRISFLDFLILSLVYLSFSCRKLIDIPSPVNSITTLQVFATESEAASAVAGIYSQMINVNDSYASYSTSIFCGLSADELSVNPAGNASWAEFLSNEIGSDNNLNLTNFWSRAYKTVYTSCAVIENLQRSPSLRDSVRKELIGEAKFLRAFAYFYLVNLYGAVPMVTTSNWRNTNSLPRQDTKDIYDALTEDLKNAVEALPADYSVGKGQRILPNKAAALALLSRVYLFRKDWTAAEQMASRIITDPQFALSSIDQVFKKNSSEAIWQLQQNSSLSPSFNITREAYFLIPRVLNGTTLPAAWISPSLRESMDPQDLRKTKWIDSTLYSVNGTMYFLPGKYKAGPSQIAPNGTATEYYMVFRLAEQYLIRAEAYMHQNKLANAVSDINKIRQRAGIPLLSMESSGDEIMKAIIKERRHELFAEWGHRWLDLKRWGLAGQVLAETKGSGWQSTDSLYPIPGAELRSNPNLTQNEGY